MTNSQEICTHGPCRATREGTPPPQQMLAVGLLENCLFMLAGCAAGPRSDLGIVGFSSSFLCVSPAWWSRATENPERLLCDPRAIPSRECAAPLPCMSLNLARYPVTEEPGSDTSNK